MKKSVAAKVIDSLHWSDSEAVTTPKGIRFRRHCVATDGFRNVMKNHSNEMRAAGFVVNEHGMILWFSAGGKFAYPEFSKPSVEKPRDPDAQPKKKKKPPQTAREMELRFPTNAELELNGMKESFRVLQAQFDDMRRLYEFMKRERDNALASR